MKYKSFERNHVIIPGREQKLKEFLSPPHKSVYKCNSNSEDALTWSVFDLLRNLNENALKEAISRIIEDSFEGETNFQIDKVISDCIHIGKRYSYKNEYTEVDASIETEQNLIFFEAKLYSSMSLADPPMKPHDQLAKKLRVGGALSLELNKRFVFIIIDIGPFERTYRHLSKEKALSRGSGYKDKWKTAWWFNYYKFGRNNSMRPIKEVFAGIESIDTGEITKNMGWITWADLFKTVLQNAVTEGLNEYAQQVRKLGK